VRIAAVAALMVLGTKTSVEPLLNALRDEDLRWFASLALEKLGPESPELFLAAQPNDPTMALRTELLVRLGPPILPVLYEYLRAEAPSRKAVALWVLGEIGEPEAAAPVAELLGDPLVGWLAGRTLRQLGEQGFDQLARHASHSRQDAGALQAIDTLALYDDPRALQILEQCAYGTLPRVARVRAAVRLSMIGEPEAVDRLRNYLEGDGRDLWPDVEQALRAEGQVR
jgi:HEAT repeat protein